MKAKTNVMRTLEQKRITYAAHSYDSSAALSALEVAAALGREPGQVFKTLVTVGKSHKNYVFVIPATGELDLKKAADSVHEKSIELIKAQDLLPLTGYIHGGCSPIGMKKTFTTVIDASAAEWDTVIFSAGKIGAQVEMSLAELKKALAFELAGVV